MTTPPPTASRARDAEIAQTLFGWVWLAAKVPQVLPKARWLAPPEEANDERWEIATLLRPPEYEWWLADMSSHGECVPHYSSTWDGMRLVVERMAAMGWSLTINYCTSGAVAGFPCLVTLGRNVPGNWIEWESSGTTLPEAVASCALFAVRGGIK